MMVQFTKKKLFFLITTITIPILFFVFLEIFLQLIHYGNNLNLFIEAGNNGKYLRCNPIVANRFFSAQTTIPDPSNDLFLKQKPGNGFRIFILGGSTAAGYPYPSNISLSKILSKSLQATYPDTKIEVISTAITAINSYSLLDFLDEILDQKPDLLLIYTGHNEFYGALGAASTESIGQNRSLIKTYLYLQRYKTFLLVRDLISKIFKSANIANDNPTATLMERMVEEQTIPYGSQLYQAGRNQFKHNLQEILQEAANQKVPVYIGELISNIRDQRPFISCPSEGHPQADSIFALAESLENNSEYKRAKQNFYLAKDLDGLRFRATEEFNTIIHNIAAEYNAVVIPIKQIYENSSPNKLIGNNLLCEHLHPNVDGYFLMAKAFYGKILKDVLIAQQPDHIKGADVVESMRSIMYSELDSLYGALRIQILKSGWPFVENSVPNSILMNFEPTTLRDSLLLKVFQDKQYTLMQAHYDLADAYEKSRQYDLAFKEYSALMNLTPFISAPYLKTAEMLIKMGIIQSAYPILLQSLEFENSAYANKWVGQILIQNRQIKRAIPYLEKAKNIQANDPQLIYNLSGAYASNGEFRKALDELDYLDQISPRFGEAQQLRTKIQNTMKH